MAWIARDNFESYLNGSLLNGLNKGSGWNGAWVSSGNSWTVATAPSGGAGGVCLANTTTGGETQAYRNITPTDAGTVSCLVRLTANNIDDCTINLYEDQQGTGRMFVKFNGSGNIQIYDDDLAGYTNIQAYSANTWYRIYFDFSNTEHPGLYRVKVDNGNWTNWILALVGVSSYDNIDRFRVTNDGVSPVTIYVDSIKSGNRWLMGPH